MSGRRAALARRRLRGIATDPDNSMMTAGAQTTLQKATAPARARFLIAFAFSLLATATPVTASPADAASAAAPICHELGLATCPQPFDAELPPARDMLIWDQERRVIGFRNTYRLYRGDVFHADSGRASPLPLAPTPLRAVEYRMAGERLGLDDYLRRQTVTGLLVLKDGRIAFEYYGHGNTPSTLWTSRSVAKSVVSILVGIAVQERRIQSLEDPLTKYLPELRGSAWDGVQLRHLLQHTSGVSWNEHYDDPDSDFTALTHCEATPTPYSCVMQLLQSLHRVSGVAPGELWSYNTGGAWLLGRALERATGMTLARYLETRLWRRAPMQSDGIWQALAPGDADMGGHGFNATLRDWGRFALFVENGGHLPDGTPLLPSGWLAESVAWTKARGSVSPDTPDGAYGYQWWSSGRDGGCAVSDRPLATAADTFWALGIYGQAIGINRPEHLVVVQWSAWEHAETPTSMYDEQAHFFCAVARALRHGQ